MAHEKVFAICENKCWEETMTKELQAITRYVKRGGQIWIRIFPHIPVTKKPLDVKMGSGKGEPQFHVAKVKAGTVMFEIAGVTEAQAREALRLASHKLPVRCRIVKKEEQ